VFSLLYGNSAMTHPLKDTKNIQNLQNTCEQDAERSGHICKIAQSLTLNSK